MTGPTESERRIYGTQRDWADEGYLVDPKLGTIHMVTWNERGDLVWTGVGIGIGDQLTLVFDEEGPSDQR